MMSERENYELIEKYLAQELSEAEARAFETRAKADAEFAEEVILHTLAKQEMEAAANEELRTRLRASLDTNEQAKVIPFNKTRRQWLSLAAAIILLIACIPLLRNILEPDYITSKELYTQHFQLPELRALDTVRGGEKKDSSNNQETWTKALLAISEDQPGEAIKQFDVLMQDTSFMNRFNSTIHYQVGVAWLLNEDPEKAIAYFDKVDSQTTFGANARWYKGMAYLKLDNRTQALDIFVQAIEDPQQKPVRKEEAKKIVEKLKIEK